MPAAPKPATDVFLALLSVSATPYLPSRKPCCSNQASAQRLSASKSPSSASSSVRSIIASASCTETVFPSASSTLAYRVGADGSLREVGRCNVASLEVTQRSWKLRLQGGS